ncbi:MAG: DUF5615 family PIN-like protein [Bryobacter sp.]|nr:DUF5615 family PIN-like protein [Bryobacter sp.]
MNIRYLADCDLHAAIVGGVLRVEPSISFTTADEAGLRELGDKDVLRIATQRESVLVTHDAASMPIHFGAYLMEGNFSFGVIVIPQSMGLRDAIERLVWNWAHLTQEDWLNRIVRLPV